MTNSESRPTIRRHRTGFRFLFVLICLFVAPLIAETIVRIGDLAPRVYAPRRFEPGGGVPFTTIREGSISLLVYQPKVTFASVYDPSGDDRGYLKPDGKISYRINEQGYRGGSLSVAKTDGLYRVVCLGDSITFGEGVREEDTYPVRLETLLGASMPGRTVQVVNAGVQGYGTREEAALFFARCEKLKPDVVTLGFFLNDATDFGETIRQNDERVRDLPLSGLASLSKIWEMIERRSRAVELQEQYFETTRRSFNGESWQIAKQLLAMMQQQSKKDGFRFVVVLFPMLWELDGPYPFEDLHARIAAACQEAGCEWIDLLPVLRGRRAESLWVHPTDQHPNEIVHALAAERIASILPIKKM